MELTFDLSGFSAYEAALVRLIAMLRDLRPFWPRLQPLYAEWVREQFGTEGEYLLGHGWEPLSEDYMAWKMQHYPGKGILYATGQLYGQVTRPRRVATPTTLIWYVDPFPRREGTTMDPAWFQEGTDRMPQRAIFPEELLPRQRAEVEAAAELWIDEMAAKLGLHG